jgi:ribosomal protein S12 methylthiotransferase accessory factor
MKTAMPHELELRDVPAGDPWETIRRGSRLISRKVGLIRRVDETRYQAQDPVVFAAGVQPADFSRCLSGGVAIKAGGAGGTAAIALASAIGEAVERHCACFPDAGERVFGTFRELAEDAVAPDLLRLFSRAQVERFGPEGPDYFDEGSRIGWVRGYSLTQRRERLVPASYVYLNHRPREGEANIGVCPSTGLAAATTREEAILSALLETVERDAFTLAWMHRRPGRRIDIDSEDLKQTLRIRLWDGRPSVDVKFFDLTTDVPIPVALVVMRRLSDCGPVACVGAAARLSPRQAIGKCIQEAGQNFPYLRHLLESEKGWQPAADFSNLVTFDYHFLNYVKRPDLVSKAFAFFDECEDCVPLSQLPDHATGRVRADLEYCVAQLGEAGYEVIVTDITTPEIAEVGFSAVRVIVPGLVPLHGDHLRPFLGVRRMFEAPFLPGSRRSERGSGIELNPFPHPFP